MEIAFNLAFAFLGITNPNIPFFSSASILSALTFSGR